MPSLIEILLTATDQTGPGFASARANLQAFQAAFSQQANAAAAAGNAAAQSGQQVAAGAQQAVNGMSQQATSARTLEQLEARLANTQLKLALASTDSRGKIALLRQEHQRLEAATRPLVLSTEEYTRRMNAAAEAALRLKQAENAQNRGLGPTLPRSLEQFGTGALMQAGIASGAAILGQQLVQLGSESVDLAVRAETIGTAYEGATRRAGIGADDLLAKLNAAARGTVADTELMASANKAMALGVGRNVDEIAQLLAIARQKGKDFGETTNQAFEDITIGLGRLSPRILDNLGIILDENKIYQEYAKSIGVAEGKLTDQQKRQSLVNELLRTNTDLVTKNATAQIDAGDRIAQANARRESAQTRAGVAVTPLKIGFLDTVAGTFEGLFRTTRGQADDLNQTLLAASTSYADYADRIQAKRQELLRGGGAGKSEQEELFLAMVTQQEYDLAHALAVQADQHERNAAAATRNADALKNLATVTTNTRSTHAIGFAGFGNPDQVVASTMHASTAIQQLRFAAASAPSYVTYVTNNIYPQGLIHTARDLSDYMKDAMKDDSYRNGVEVSGVR